MKNCEAQEKGRAKGRPRKVTQRSFINLFNLIRMYKHPIGLLYSVLAVEFCIRIDQYIIINKQNIVPNFEYFRICFSFDLIYEFTYL